MINYPPPPREVLYMWQVRTGQASDQQRQRAPHHGDVLQKLSQECPGATSRDSQATPGECLKRYVARQVYPHLRPTSG